MATGGLVRWGHSGSATASLALQHGVGLERDLAREGRTKEDKGLGRASIFVFLHFLLSDKAKSLHKDFQMKMQKDRLPSVKIN